MRRRNDTKVILSAMKDDMVTARDIAEKTGFSTLSVGALLRNARRNGLVMLVCERPVKRNGHWQMTSFWAKAPKITLSPFTQSPLTHGIDADDLAWMAYWNEKREQRLKRREQNACLSATAD